jgi:hypothetical protein
MRVPEGLSTFINYYLIAASGPEALLCNPSKATVLETACVFLEEPNTVEGKREAALLVNSVHGEIGVELASSIGTSAVQIHSKIHVILAFATQAIFVLAKSFIGCLYILFTPVVVCEEAI